MTKIQLNKQFDIDQKIDSISYLNRFLDLAEKSALLNEIDLESLQLQSYTLLSKQLVRYTGGTSNSIAEETAQGIYQSILYTIGVYLKSLPDSVSRADQIKSKPLEELFLSGKQLIQEKRSAAEQLLFHIQKTGLSTDNIAYQDTVFTGIPGFFSAYDSDYFAHDTPGSIDYPLSNDPMILTGIEYISDYLAKLSAEIRFCCCFSSQEIEFLLKCYDINYKELLINLYEPVLTNALGTIMAEKVRVSLSITPADRSRIQKKFSDVLADELKAALIDASKKLLSELKLQDPFLQEYISLSINDVTSRMMNALEHFNLQTMFLSLEETNDKTLIDYQDGEKKDDEIFRRIVENIRECRLPSDKSAIIKREISSLADFIDILEGSCIFGNEYFDIFQTLEETQLYLLLQKIASDGVSQNGLHLTAEKEWQEKLLLFLNQQQHTDQDETFPRKT